MKKAFTLIELVTLLVVLSVVALIAFPVVYNAINESRQKAYDSQVEIIIEAAKRWGVKNNDKIPTGDEVYKLRLNVLISEKYISNIENGKLKNPKKPGDSMDGCIYIYYSNEYNQPIYEYREEC